VKIYLVVKTAREGVTDFPNYFSNPHRPAVCVVDSYTGESCTLDRDVALETSVRQTAEYGEYFVYSVHELEVG